MKRTVGLTIPIFLLVLAGCSGMADLSQSAPPSPTDSPIQPELSQETIDLGKVVYADNCANCHGENLEGEAEWKQQNEDGSFRSPPHTADGHTWHHADDVLIEAIEKGGVRFEGMNIGGSSNMPAFAESLTDEQISAVLEYIKSTWPEDIQAIQRQQTEQSPSS